MEQDRYEKIIKKIAILLISISSLIFVVLMFAWPQTPDIIAYILISLFIFGITFLLARKHVRKLVVNINGNKKILVISLLVLLFAIFFCWFEVRPSLVRKDCEWEIFSNERATYSGSTAIRQNNKYRQCLIRNGLKPESLFVNTDQ